MADGLQKAPFREAAVYQKNGRFFYWIDVCGGWKDPERSVKFVAEYKGCLILPDEYML